MAAPSCLEPTPAMPPPPNVRPGCAVTVALARGCCVGLGVLDGRGGGAPLVAPDPESRGVRSNGLAPPGCEELPPEEVEDDADDPVDVLAPVKFTES